MSDELFNVMTPFADVADLGQGYMNRADGERLWVPLPTPATEGEQIQFVIHLADGVPAFAGAGRCIQVADQGEEVDPSVRFEALLDGLLFDERSQPVYDYIVAVRAAILGEEYAASEEYDAAEDDGEDDGPQVEEVEGYAQVEEGHYEVATVPPGEEGAQARSAYATDHPSPGDDDFTNVVAADEVDGHDDAGYVDVSADASAIAPGSAPASAHTLEAVVEVAAIGRADALEPMADAAHAFAEDVAFGDEHEPGESPAHVAQVAFPSTTEGGAAAAGHGADDDWADVSSDSHSDYEGSYAGPAVFDDPSQPHPDVADADEEDVDAPDGVYGVPGFEQDPASEHERMTLAHPANEEARAFDLSAVSQQLGASAQQPPLTSVDVPEHLQIPMDLTTRRSASGRPAEQATETVINPSIMPIATGILTRPAIALHFRPVRALGPARSVSTGQFIYPAGILPIPGRLPRYASDGNAALAAQPEPAYEQDVAVAEEEVQYSEAEQYEVPDEEAPPIVVGPEGFMRRRDD